MCVSSGAWRATAAAVSLFVQGCATEPDGGLPCDLAAASALLAQGEATGLLPEGWLAERRVIRVNLDLWRQLSPAAQQGLVSMAACQNGDGRIPPGPYHVRASHGVLLMRAEPAARQFETVAR